MDIGRLFRQAWGLFVKDVGPLLVGSLIAGIIPAVAGGIMVVGALGATVAAGGMSEQGGDISLGAVGWGVFGVALVLIVLVSVFLTVPLYAGLTLGVIRRVREGRAMGYGDAFEGFKMFGRLIAAYLLISLVFLGAMLLPAIFAAAAAWLSSVVLGVFAGLLFLVAILVIAYLSARWAYVVPLIVDRGATAMGAIRQSGVVVAGAGWWITFLALFVMYLVVGVVSGVLGVIPVIGSIASLFLTPFALTYVVAMYFQATREERLVMDALQGVPASPAWQASPTPPPGSADWRAAADPLPPTTGAGGGWQAAPGPPPAAGSQPTVVPTPPDVASNPAAGPGTGVPLPPPDAASAPTVVPSPGESPAPQAPQAPPPPAAPMGPAT